MPPLTDNDIGQAHGIGVVDIDNDGANDVVVVCLSDYIYTFKPIFIDGKIDRFIRRSDYNFDSSPYYHEVRFHDFNRDNFTDLVAFTGYNELVVAENDGTGRFPQEKRRTLVTGLSKMNDVVIADFNDDDCIDIAASVSSPAVAQIFLNDETCSGNFSVGPVFPFPSGPMVTLDANGDGYYDIISSEAFVQLFLNSGVNGTASFQTPGIRQVPSHLAFCYAMAIGNLDTSSAEPELILACSNSATGDDTRVVSWASVDGSINPPLHSLQDEEFIDQGAYAYSVTSGLIDDDSFVDVMVSNALGDSIKWFKNYDGLGNFSSPVKLLESNFSSSVQIYLEDLDSDGATDLIIYDTAYNGIFWFRNEGNNDNFQLGAKTLIADRLGEITGLAIGNFSHTSYLDIICVYYHGIVHFKNENGTHGSLTEILYSYRVSMKSIVSMDVNNDGWLDFIVVDKDELVYVYENDLNGSFLAIQQDQIAPPGSATLSLHDLNGDEKEDLIIHSPYMSYHFWQPQNNSFAAESGSFRTGRGRSAFGDMNGDGFADFVLCDTSGGLTVQFNLGNGTFDDNAVLIADTALSRCDVSGILITLGDLDVDGNLDVIFIAFPNQALEFYWFAQTPGSNGTLFTKLEETQFDSLPENMIFREDGSFYALFEGTDVDLPMKIWFHRNMKAPTPSPTTPSPTPSPTTPSPTAAATESLMPSSSQELSSSSSSSEIADISISSASSMLSSSSSAAPSSLTISASHSSSSSSSFSSSSSLAEDISRVESSSSSSSSDTPAAASVDSSSPSSPLPSSTDMSIDEIDSPMIDSSLAGGIGAGSAGVVAVGSFVAVFFVLRRRSKRQKIRGEEEAGGSTESIAMQSSATKGKDEEVAVSNLKDPKSPRSPRSHRSHLSPRSPRGANANPQMPRSRSSKRSSSKRKKKPAAAAGTAGEKAEESKVTAAAAAPEDEGYDEPPLQVLQTIKNEREANSSSTVSSTAEWAINMSDIEEKKKIGEGSFGLVWKARWRRIDVAVKEVKGVNASERDALLDEAEKLAKLRPYKHVVLFYGVVLSPSLAVVLEFCQLGSLDSRLFDKAATPLSDEEVADVVLGSAKGLLHLHEEGVVHRDIAARNILLDRDGNGRLLAKISDMGMARTGSSNAEEDATTKTTIGPLKWQAPEQLSDAVVSYASDVYSYGVLLFEIYQRERPWASLTPVNAAAKVMGGATLEVPKKAPEFIQSVMKETWLFDRAKRPNMENVLKQLEKGFENTETQYSAPPERIDVE